tara:strand:- start:10306 stop:11742 length:1437 start_codon:yes stop_codon:yes gene_type:complete
LNIFKIARIIPLHIKVNADGMINDLYKGEKHFDEMSYDEMVQKLYQMEFALSLGWSIEMRSLGHEVHDIFISKLVQERWADEHGLKDWERPHPGIILRQIEHYKPDILWIHALSKIPILLRLNLKKYFPFIKAIIGFAVDDPKYANMKDLDLLLCDSDIVCTRAKEAGINAKILYNGFDDSILNIIDPIKFSKQDRIYDFTFAGSSGYNMGNRYTKRYWTLVELAQRTNLQLWSFERESSKNSINNNKEALNQSSNLLSEKGMRVDVRLKMALFVFARKIIKGITWIIKKDWIMFFLSLINLKRKRHFQLFVTINSVFSKRVGEKGNKTPVRGFFAGRSSENNVKVPVSPIHLLFPDSCHEPVFGINMFHIWQRSKLTLNAYADNGYQFPSNPRMFEATGVGSCLVVENTPGIADFFEPDKEILTYQSIDECIEKVNYLLVHESERIEMAIAGQKRTLESHSYKNRCEQLNEYLQKLL